MSLLATFIPEESHGSLESLIGRVSLESNFVSNMLETFRHVIPGFSFRLKETNQRLLDSSKEQTATGIVLTSKQKTAIAGVEQAGFINVGERMISVPENFKGNFTQYAMTLNQIVNAAYAIQNGILAEYTTILASFVTNKEDKISLKDHTPFFIRIQKERENFVKSLHVFFPSDTGRTKAKLKDVMGRANELEQLMSEVNKLTKSHSEARLQEIHTSVQHCVDMLEILIKGVEDGSITNVTPNAVMNISTGAYEVAKYVEFVGVLYHDVTVFLNTVNNMLDTVTVVSPMH